MDFLHLANIYKNYQIILDGAEIEALPNSETPAYWGAVMERLSPSCPAPTRHLMNLSFPLYGSVWSGYSEFPNNH